MIKEVEFRSLFWIFKLDGNRICIKKEEEDVETSYCLENELARQSILALNLFPERIFKSIRLKVLLLLVRQKHVVESPKDCHFSALNLYRANKLPQVLPAEPNRSKSDQSSTC